MTFEEIYNQLKENTGDRFTMYELLQIFTNESDWVGTPYQMMKLGELQYNITGIRVGNCSGCKIDMLRNMSKWLKQYEATRVEEVKPKMGRPKSVK